MPHESGTGERAASSQSSKLRIADQGNSIITALSFTATDMAANMVPLKFSRIFTVPAETTRLRVTLSNDATAGSVWLDEIIIQRMNGGELIVEGAIIAPKIAANAIEADMIEANAITADNVAAGAITTLKLDALAVTGAKIAADVNKLAANAIT